MKYLSGMIQSQKTCTAKSTCGIIEVKEHKQSHASNNGCVVRGIYFSDLLQCLTLKHIVIQRLFM